MADPERRADLVVRRHAPKPDSPVGIGGSQYLAVGTEGHVLHLSPADFDRRADLALGRYLPQPGGAVGVRRRQDLAVWTEGQLTRAVAAAAHTPRCLHVRCRRTGRPTAG